jgi:hypothetical protein
MTIRRKSPKHRDSRAKYLMPTRTVRRTASTHHRPRNSPHYKARRGGATTTDNNSPYLAFLQALIPLFAASGILVYTLLTIQYERFYGALGIKPADVGLSYAGVLASSTGYVLFVLISTLLAAIFAVAGTTLLVSILKRQLRPADIVAEGRSLFILVRESRQSMIGVLLFAVVVVPFIVALTRTYPSPETVRQGLPITPRGSMVFSFRLPLDRIPIFAYPAVVDSIEGAEANSSLHELRARPLLYLGQSNSIAVLYDSGQDGALYLPLSETTLRIDPCSTYECLFPPRVEVWCVKKSKAKDRGIASVGYFLDQALTQVPMEEVLTDLRERFRSYYYRDSNGDIVDLVGAGPLRKGYVATTRDSTESALLKELPLCP